MSTNTSFYFLDVEWRFLLCCWLHLWFSILCFLVCSSRITSHCYDNNICFPQLSRYILNILVGVRIGILHSVWISQISSLPLHNKLQTLFDSMIRGFVIQTCLCRVGTVPDKMSLFPSIITYDLASSMTKSSSLSSTSKISTPLGLRVLLLQILVLRVFVPKTLNLWILNLSPLGLQLFIVLH